MLQQEDVEAALDDGVEHVDHRVGVGRPLGVTTAALLAAREPRDVAVVLADHVLVDVLALGGAVVADAPLHRAEADDAVLADLAEDGRDDAEVVEGTRRVDLQAVPHHATERVDDHLVGDGQVQVGPDAVSVLVGDPAAAVPVGGRLVALAPTVEVGADDVVVAIGLHATGVQHERLRGAVDDLLQHGCGVLVERHDPEVRLLDEQVHLDVGELVRVLRHECSSLSRDGDVLRRQLSRMRKLYYKIINKSIGSGDWVFIR